jgi:hypothetical protein
VHDDHGSPFPKYLYTSLLETLDSVLYSFFTPYSSHRDILKYSQKILHNRPKYPESTALRNEILPKTCLGA